MALLSDEAKKELVLLSGEFDDLLSDEAKKEIEEISEMIENSQVLMQEYNTIFGDYMICKKCERRTRGKEDFYDPQTQTMEGECVTCRSDSMKILKDVIKSLERKKFHSNYRRLK